MPEQPRNRTEDIHNLIEAAMGEETGNMAGTAAFQMATAMMREVKDDVRGVRSDVATVLKKMDDVATERREEAYEKGKQDQRIESLENQMKSHKVEHGRMKMWVLGIGGTLFVTITIALMAFVARLIALLPASVTK